MFSILLQDLPMRVASLEMHGIGDGTSLMLEQFAHSAHIIAIQEQKSLLEVDVTVICDLKWWYHLRFYSGITIPLSCQCYNKGYAIHQVLANSFEPITAGTPLKTVHTPTQFVRQYNHRNWDAFAISNRPTIWQNNNPSIGGVSSHTNLRMFLLLNERISQCSDSSSNFSLS